MRTEDARRWRRLLDAADGAIERPADGLKAADFKHWADLCFHRAVMPGGADREAARPFVHLVGFGRAWGAMTAQDRRSNADAVIAASERCAAQLEAANAAGQGPPEPARRFRADIDG